MTLKDILEKKKAEYSFFTEEECLIAINDKHNKYSLMLCKIQTPEICKIAVQKSGQQLRFVRNQTPELCLAAVKRDGIALQYVHDKTPEICLAAVENDGMALEYVKEQTLEICLAAMNSETSSFAIEYINDDIFKQESPAPKELTVAELEALLGYPVKIVK